MWKKIKSVLNRLKIGLAVGMKTADEQILHNDNIADDVNSAIHKQQDDHRVAKHLLKGEITQEVKELVHRTIAVDRESQEYEVYSPMKALKLPKRIEKRVPEIYNKEKYSLLTVQSNKTLGDNVLEALENVDMNNIETDKNGEISQEIGKLKKKHRYTLKVTRNITFTPRYFIEEYAKKLVCFTINQEENKYMLDFYFTKYPNDKDWKSKGFVREVEYMKNDRRRSDITDIRTVSFVTSNAYGFYDGISFNFDNLHFEEVLDFDGSYILRFSASLKEKPKDFFDDLYNEEMDRKYKNKAPKKESTVSIDPYSPMNERTYTCSVCGKVVKYNVESVDNKIASDETVKDGVTEYMDMENAEQTFGRAICKDCLAKHNLELLNEYAENLKKKEE